MNARPGRIYVATLLPLSLALGAIGCDGDARRFGSGNVAAMTERDFERRVMDSTVGAGHRSALAANRTGLPSSLVSSAPEFGRFERGILARAGDVILIGDASGNPYVHAVNTVDKAVMWSTGHRGEGPGEIGGGAFMMSAASSSGIRELWIYDAALVRMIMWRLDGSGHLISRDSVLRMPERYGKVYWRTDSSLVAVADTALVIISSRTGREVSRLGSRVRESDGVPRSERRGAYQGSGCMDPSRNHFAFAYLYAGRMSVVDLRGEPSDRAVETPVSYPPSLDRHPITFQKKFMGAGQNVRVAYLGCTATERHIYALFSGKLNRSFRYPANAESDEVHVFAWDGRFEGTIRLDHLATGLIASSSGDRIYTLTLHPEPGLRETVLGENPPIASPDVGQRSSTRVAKR